ncbi:MAG: glycosyltransferase family 2 protein [Methanoregula sp.]
MVETSNNNPDSSSKGAFSVSSPPQNSSTVEVNVLDGTHLKGLVAVIPAYNEQVSVGSVILLAREYVDTVIVVNDGSSDRTAEVAKLAGAEVISLEHNMGKAHALLLGLRKARESHCTAVVMLDADGQHHTRDIPRIAAPVLSGDADLVIGSRFIHNSGKIPLYRKFGQKTLDVFTNIGTKQKVSDSQSGYRALSRKALEYLDFRSDGYNVESDMIAHFVAKGLVLREVPIGVRYDVPNKHKKNAVSHGMGVLAQLINLISYRRPLLAFGIPGFLMIVAGLISEIWVFAELYAGHSFHYVIAIGSAFVLVLGMLLVIAGLILNTLVRIVNECK